MRIPSIEELLITLPAILAGLVLHELAHAYVAYRLGDPTAKNMGRLTLNPLKHLDPLGTIFLVFFYFGWAKPVPINPMYFRNNRQRGILWVSLAGPATNLVIAIVTAVVWRFIEPNGMLGAMLFYMFRINLILAVFNFIPVPPLDGSKILAGLLPPRYSHVIFNLEKYGFVILILLMVTGATNLILIPGVRFLGGGIASLLGAQSLKDLFMLYI